MERHDILHLAANKTRHAMKHTDTQREEKRELYCWVMKQRTQASHLPLHQSSITKRLDSLSSRQIMHVNIVLYASSFCLSAGSKVKSPRRHADGDAKMRKFITKKHFESTFLGNSHFTLTLLLQSVLWRHPQIG
jgi:hypothetical protein